MTTDQQPQTPDPEKLWMDDGGRIACTRHSGGYLTAAAQVRPRARSHRTPRGTFTLVTALDVEAWNAEGDLPPMGCETCGAPPKV